MQRANDQGPSDLDNLRETLLGSSSVDLKETVRNPAIRRRSSPKFNQTDARTGILVENYEMSDFEKSSKMGLYGRDLRRSKSCYLEKDVQDFRKYVMALPPNEVLSKHDLQLLIAKFFNQ